MLGGCLLFCPGDRPDRFGKALDSGADFVILDLEDAVAPDRKDEARRLVASWLETEGADRVVVRANDLSTDVGASDLDMLRSHPPAAVLIPKAESAQRVRDAAASLADGGAPIPLCLLIETAAGVLEALRLCEADESVVAATWGPYDLTVDLGGMAPRGPDGGYTSTLVVARSLVLMAAAAAGVTPIDTITAEIEDIAVVERDGREAANLGFEGKLAIHPAQVAPIRDAFRPRPEDVARASRLLAERDRTGRVTFRFEGEMVDRPILSRAERVLRAAARFSKG